MTAAAVTSKGLATRTRIIETAAELVLARGARGTTLDDIRAGTETSKSQLFHYFPGGKSELVSAIARLQSERVLDAQQPFLARLDNWDAWEGWRRSVLDHYGSQAHLGCPIGALASEMTGSDPTLAGKLAAHLDIWRDYLEAGLHRMRDSGLLRQDADPRTLALSTFAALQGGLLLTQTMRSLEPLEAALTGALAALRSFAR
jgi:AcrR family transcriptional regulator